MFWTDLGEGEGVETAGNKSVSNPVTALSPLSTGLSPKAKFSGNIHEKFRASVHATSRLIVKSALLNLKKSDRPSRLGSIKLFQFKTKTYEKHQFLWSGALTGTLKSNFYNR